MGISHMIHEKQTPVRVSAHGYFPLFSVTRDEPRQNSSIKAVGGLNNTG